MTTMAFLMSVIVGAMAVFLFRPEWIVRILMRQSRDVLYYAEIKDHVVALTIDDGPDLVSTPKILEVLKRYNAHATFFLITVNVAGNEEIVLRIIKEGHEIGNHSVKDEASIRLTTADFERKLLEAHEILRKFSKVGWFRPGSGLYNRAMLEVIKQQGYQCVLGSVYPFDPQIPHVGFASWYIKQNVQAGSIIVLHDKGSRGERTTMVLEQVLPELKRRGFQIVTVSELKKLSSGNN